MTAANVAFAGMKAYQALSNLKDSIAAGNLASVSLTAGFTYSKNETSVSSSTPVLPTISGNSVDISTNGDFVSRGLQISAQASPDHAADPMNGSVLISANNIDMAGARKRQAMISEHPATDLTPHPLQPHFRQMHWPASQSAVAQARPMA
ncbi:hypothetical protein PH547_21120 [Rhizobium sp. CNPSo 3464]|uniref:hypothetical protein n=1 Tax=Rhizobium sp. CNPSo 3464 TaxID=3021406 RepID=UPI00254AF322|nr:hypothetical protein [Rhizobium sp. CNPSo 3464]MDK4741391.1 hypothetical protein [Rhizobium sp. CNPSo 3464]